ncbi:MAG: RNA polymerase sigma factor [Oscillospiraceae bacterium]
MTLSILKDPYNAQDAVQETFMKIREVSHLYRPNGKPLAWILTIAKNISLNFLRKTSRETPSQDCVPEDDLRFSCVSDPTDRLVLSTALNILSEDERQIILLHVVSGVKHMEIAKALQLPLSTVLSRYHRALKKLKKHLVGRGEF